MRNSQRPLVLASSSRYRRALLSRLGLRFESESPDVDELPLPNERPMQQVRRLAEIKAHTVAERRPDALIIGCDQLACLDDRVLGKPGTHARALEQLSAASGRTVTFLTGLCLLNAASGRAHSEVVPFEVRFRALDQQALERYLKTEQPYDCAGSFKSEGLGVTLFEYMRGDDPNALVGLPLIALVAMLAKEGLELP